MKQFAKAHPISKAIVFCFVLFNLSIPFSIAATKDSATYKQAETVVSFLQRLLQSDGAQNLLAYEEDSTYLEVEELLIRAQTALENENPAQAEKLAKQGFDTITKAIKQRSKSQAKTGETVQQKIERYQSQHDSLSDLYFRLTAKYPHPTEKQQSILDRLAHHLSTAEAVANKGFYHKALNELGEIRKLVNGSSRSNNQAPVEEKVAAKVEKAIIEEKPDDIEQPVQPIKAAPVVERPEPTQSSPPIKKEKAATPASKPLPAAKASPPPVVPPNKVVTVKLTPKQQYKQDAERFRAYQMIIPQLLDTESLTDEMTKELADASEKARMISDRARGQAIDGNYREATRLITEATNELDQTLRRFGVTPK